MIQTKHILSSFRRALSPMFALVLLFCNTAYPSNAWADTETAKIRSGVDFRGSRFAQSVSISNDIAVIGASEENNRFSSTGAAYIYRKVQGDWQREARFQLDNRQSFDRFGWSVAASGNVAVVGTNGSGQGVVAIFHFEGSQWRQRARLSTTRDGISAFGRSVAVSGDVTIIGAPYSNDGVVTAGAAFIYRFNGTSWAEEAALSTGSFQSPTQFGLDVAIYGDLAVVGAPTPNQREAQGSVYVYRFDGTNWILETELTPDDDGTADHFGTSVSVSENTIVIGSPHDDQAGEDSGSAYVFRFNGTEWSQEARLNPDDGGSFEYFGSDVALLDNVVIVGAPGDDDNGRDSGSAYEFRYDGINWIQASKLVASVGSEIANLGGSVSISGDTALIAASGDDEDGIISGAAYTFDVAIDTDGDGLSDAQDNCPLEWNPMQEDFDGDLSGDVCDLDDDNDGLNDDQDPLPYDGLVSVAPTPESPVGDNIPLGVDFEWSPVNGAALYTIEVQHDGVVRAYENLIMATVACNNQRCRFTKPDAALEGVNRWRLRAGTNNGNSDWSPWTEFVVNGSTSPIDEEAEPEMPIIDATGIPALPQPASPSGAVVYPGIDFRWSQVPGATNYSIEIQHNGSIRGYASMIEADLLCANEECVYTKTDAALPGNNRWRLRAGNAVGSTTWTPWTEFTATQSTGSNSIIPNAPTPGSPDGSIASPIPNYQWQAVTGATRYAIEIQHNGLIRSYDAAIDASVSCSEGTCHYIKSDAARTGDNRWRLRAGSAAGFSQWSDWRAFVAQ